MNIISKDRNNYDTFPSTSPSVKKNFASNFGRLEIFNFRNNPKERSLEEKGIFFENFLVLNDDRFPGRVDVDEDRDPGRGRGNKEETGARGSRKMMNETGRTMESGFLFPSPFEFSNRSNRDIDEPARRENRSLRATCERGRLLLLSSGKRYRFLFFLFFFSRAFSFSIDFCSLPASFKQKLIDSW